MSLDKKAPAQTGRAKAAPKTRRGPGRPTRQEAQERDVELLETALDLFLQNGFERTTIDAITAAVGMAKRTVYARYGDKLTLFKAALQRAIDEWDVPLEQLQQSETNDLEETLLTVSTILVNNVLSPAGLRLMQITNAESTRMPEIALLTNAQGTRRSVAFLADLFHRRLGRKNFSFYDAEATAYSFLFLVVGGPANMAGWGLKFGAPEVERHVRNSVHLFLHGASDDWNWSPAPFSPLLPFKGVGN